MKWQKRNLKGKSRKDTDWLVIVIRFPQLGETWIICTKRGGSGDIR